MKLSMNRKALNERILLDGSRKMPSLQPTHLLGGSKMNYDNQHPHRNNNTDSFVTCDTSTPYPPNPFIAHGKYFSEWISFFEFGIHQ